jgi:hypothetical protein
MDERLEAGDAKEILKVIGEYSKALDLLEIFIKVLQDKMFIKVLKKKEQISYILL